MRTCVTIPYQEFKLGILLLRVGAVAEHAKTTPMGEEVKWSLKDGSGLIFTIPLERMPTHYISTSTH